MTPDREDQYREALLKARRNDDAPAAQYFEQRLEKIIAEKYGPGEGSVLERVGAGMMDTVTGARQLVGATRPGEAAEQEKFARQADPGGLGRLVGQLAMSAPLLAAPATVPGALAAGGAAGLLAPTGRDEGVAGDKLTQGVIGAATGGALQGALGVALPRAISALSSRGGVTGVAARNLRAPGLDDARIAQAEDAFVQSIPQAERAQVTQRLREALDNPPESLLPEFQPTTAQVARSRALAGGEREIREAGGEFAEPLRARTAEQARAVESAWSGEFGGGQAARAREAASQFAESAKGAMPFAAPASARAGRDAFAGPLNYLRDTAQRSTGAVRARLDDLHAELSEAIATARKSGSIEPLHQFRMTSLDDALEKMNREGATKLSKTLRGMLDEGVKKPLDASLDALTQGKWSEFIKGYSTRATEAGQREAGEEWLNKFLARPATSEGTPQPGGLMPGLRRDIEQGGMFDRYGKPTYTPRGEALLRETRQQVEGANIPYAIDVQPRGSATAQNLEPMSRVLREAKSARQAAERFTEGDLGAGAVGYGVLGSPVGMIAGVVKHYIADPARAEATAAIAHRMVTLYASPREALAALTRMPLPAPEKTAIRAVIHRAAQIAGRAGVVGAATGASGGR
jgi:hypothetical protein